MPFDKVAFNNARQNLKEILKALGVVELDTDIDACFTASEKKLGFASVIRCGLGLEKQPGKYVTSGDVVLSAIAEGSAVRKFFDVCTLRFLGSLPKSVRAIVFLGLDRSYVEAVYDRMKQLHPSIRRMGPLSYATENITFIHVIHPSPLATSHRQKWLQDDDTSLAAGRREVATALGLSPEEIECRVATRSPPKSAQDSDRSSNRSAKPAATTFGCALPTTVSAKAESSGERWIGEVEINEANLRNNHFYLAPLIDQFPVDIIGGSNKASAAPREAVIDWGGPEPVRTDIDGKKKFFRARGWVGAFYDLESAEAGDLIVIEETSPYHYRVRLKKSG